MNAVRYEVLLGPRPRASEVHIKNALIRPPATHKIELFEPLLMWHRQLLLNSLIRLSEQVLETLVTVAEDPEAAPAALVKLAKIADPHVQAAVSMNPRTPSKILEKMLTAHRHGGSHDLERRIHILGNPALRTTVLEGVMNNDPSAEIREAALYFWALRMATDQQSSAEQLWGAYYLVKDTRKMRSAKRREAAKCALRRHPEFPKDRSKRR